jgi:carboxypeptidase Taq
MMMKNYNRLKTVFARISRLQYAQRILMWDEAVMMPEGAQEARAHTVATLNRTIHRMLTNRKVKTLIDKARDEDRLSSWDVVNLNIMEKKYNKAACIPLKLTEESTRAMIRCEQAWRTLRQQNNWQDFIPYLDQTFRFVREIAERESQVTHLSPYDALLDKYAEGFGQSDIDDIFLKLKQFLPALVTQIRGKQQSDTICVARGRFGIEKQKALGLKVMQALQFDFKRGRLDVSHHPFCSGGPSDVRITTRYSEDEFISSLFGICHETGHAIYEQGLPAEWLEQPIGQIDNMVMHESQSLLVEMDVCRSKAFIEYLIPLIQDEFGTQAAFTVENLYKYVTRVKPGLIRVDADEVTYPLHIILRYELEKALMSGDLQLQDLPSAWNERMAQYFDLSTLNNDKDGVMQDVHWASGAFGYFPAYTLGRLMAAQLFDTFRQMHGQFSESVRHGQFQVLTQWLNKNVHSLAASLPVNDLLINVTGAALDPQYFLAHIQRRYLD